MSKVKLSALVSDMSGKLNGSVFQRSPGGIILRHQPHASTSFKASSLKAVSCYQERLKQFGSLSESLKVQVAAAARLNPVTTRMNGSVILAPHVYYAKMNSLQAQTGFLNAFNWSLPKYDSHVRLTGWPVRQTNGRVLIQAEMGIATGTMSVLMYAAAARGNSGYSQPGPWTLFGTLTNWTGNQVPNVSNRYPLYALNSSRQFWLRLLVIGLQSPHIYADIRCAIINQAPAPPWP